MCQSSSSAHLLAPSPAWLHQVVFGKFRCRAFARCHNGVRLVRATAISAQNLANGCASSGFVASLCRRRHNKASQQDRRDGASPLNAPGGLCWQRYKVLGEQWMQMA